MSGAVVPARAKLNLSIDVLQRRPDGYHDLKMVMQTVELADELYLELREPGYFHAETNLSFLPSDGRNVAIKAAKAFFEEAGIESGVYMKIEKRIPVCAGLGGGSSDAAAVIRALNEMTGSPLGRERLLKVATEAGSDVPFCLVGGTALVEGRGELITPLPPLPDIPVVICMPRFNCQTPALFARLDRIRTRCRPDTEGLVDAVKAGDIQGVARRMYNVFEDVLDTHGSKEVSEIKRFLLEHGALSTLMSGSGSAVYGIFTDGDEAVKAAKGARSVSRSVFLTSMCRAG